ncbi:MAG: 1-acyl-sn-glycerol-3-phosphate acyltransferase [Oscillospiraceae bacterium]|nr:1-acyl-sn-glycerol-3-phosphate acyltransferase [Oscillospiraceae bacterium]
MSKEYKFYRFAYRLLAWIFFVFFGLRIKGRENVPEGAAMVCSPHSSVLDPLFLAVGLGIRHHIHYMAKKELFSGKIFGRIVSMLGAFPVDRGKNDVTAIKTAMQYLKQGEKVGIFPEGTRVSADDTVAAKSGAVKIADKTNSPVLPVYLQRGKKLFGRVCVVIGKPYYVNPDRVRLNNEQYQQKAAELMGKIKLLGEGV